MLAVGSFTFMPRVAMGEVSEPIIITGDGVSNPVTLTLAQIQAMPQYRHKYSTINTWPTKKMYLGEGIKLRDLLALAGIKENARLINFISSDGYTVTLTVKELLEDKRYYFPYLMDNNPSDGSVPGSAANAQEVEPILALISTENSDNPADMNDMDALLLMCGQRAVTEQTNNIFLKYVSKIEVLTTTPEKWDNPKASAGSGDVPAGTLIELSNKHNDADKIYYTTDGSTPNVNSPMFNWSAKRWWSLRPDSLSSINKPIEIKEGTVVKAITIGPGKADSDVVTFTYHIGSPNQSQLPGGPPTGVTLDENLVSRKVGSIVELTATVGPDNAIDTRVTWTSSDTRVATVDNYGLVTVVGPGTAVITVKTVIGGFSDACTVTGTNENAAGKSESNEDTGPGATELSQGDKAYLAAEETANAGSTIGDKVPDASSELPPPQANWQYLIAREEAQASQSANTSISDLQPEQQPGQVFEVSADTAPLQLQKEYDNLSIYTAIIFIVLFLSGAGRKYREYTKEVTS